MSKVNSVNSVNSAKPLKPYKDFFFVEPEKKTQEKTTHFGIVINEESKLYDFAEVLVGNKEFKAGDIVLFKAVPPRPEIDVDGKKYRLLHKDSVVALKKSK